MSELKEKVEKSIKRLKNFVPDEGYYLAFSGGKDSVCCKALLDMAGIKYDATYRVTTVDPPELVRFIKEQHPDVKREVPRYADDYKNQKLAGKPITMWNLIPEKLMPPTRLVRYCCEKLKESGGDGRVTVTGVRWAESTNRKNNQGPVVIQGDFKENEIDGQHGLFDDDEDAFEINDRHGSLILTNDNAENRRTMEFCYKRHKTTVNPIIEWTDEDVWEFIHAEGIPYCKLYDEGFSRLGCIGCPMAGLHERLAEFARWPKYKAAYLRAFTAMLKERERRGKLDGTWRMGTTAEDVYRWWMEFDKYGMEVLP